MEVVQYKCPNCSSNLRFDTETQKFRCEYCENSFTHDELTALFAYNENHPLDISDTHSEEKRLAEEFGRTNSLYSCPNCGAEIITDSLTAATECYYCHTPVVLTGRLAGEYKPAKIIPFKLNKGYALMEFDRWCGKKLFVPKGFKSGKTAQRIQGIYLPFWIANCTLGGTLYAKTLKKTLKKLDAVNVVEVKEYASLRVGTIDFKGVPADGSSKAGDLLMENIEPYDYGEMVDFSMSYLSGHVAEKYDMGLNTVQEHLKNRISKAGEKEFLKTLRGYDEVKITTSEYDLSNIEYKYALLPVWFLSYRYSGKDYHFAMNGQTGKFAGNLPMSKGLLALLCSLGGVLTFLLFLLGGAAIC